MSKQTWLGKSQSHIEFILARNAKSKKKSFHKYIRGKKKPFENVHLLQKGAGVLVMQGMVMDNAEVLKVFFTSAFAKKDNIQESPETSVKNWSKRVVPWWKRIRSENT